MLPETAALTRTGDLEWAVACATHPGETVSGDRHLVLAVPTGVLVAVVDGLGHGEEAASAADAALAVVRECAELPLVDVVARCHAALLGTRGAVMTLAAVHAGDATLRWTGVGNVEAVLLRAGARGPARAEGALLRGGVVGYQLPDVIVGAVALVPGDALVLATDGVRADFARHVTLRDPPDVAAARVLEHAGTGTDDALVLVARYLRAGASS